MSRRNRNTPKFGKPNNELIQQAKKLVSAWRQALALYREENCYYVGIDDNERIPQFSVTNSICAWIERNSDWESKWNSVLERIPKCAFLQQGYKGFQPNLFWMFKTAKSSGQSGLEKVLAGHYDEYMVGHKPGPQYSPDEGV